MTKVSEQLKNLRIGVKMSQKQLAELLNTSQQNIFRYESGIAFPSEETLLWYADYFDVSLDYIFGRCDNPQGKMYDFQPKIMKDNKQMQELIEMCFDPNSPANAKLKETLLRIMGEQNK